MGCDSTGRSKTCAREQAVSALQAGENNLQALEWPEPVEGSKCEAAIRIRMKQLARRFASPAASAARRDACLARLSTRNADSISLDDRIEQERAANLPALQAAASAGAPLFPLTELVACVDHACTRQRNVADRPRPGIDYKLATSTDANRVRARQRKEQRRAAKAALNCRDIHGTDDFQSASDARPMEKRDICNVEPLTPQEARALFKYDSHAEASWGDWSDDDERWTLAPHELRKLGKRVS